VTFIEENVQGRRHVHKKSRKWGVKSFRSHVGSWSSTGDLRFVSPFLLQNPLERTLLRDCRYPRATICGEQRDKTVEETDPDPCAQMLEFRRQGLGMGAIGKAVGLSSRTVWRFLRGVQAASNVPYNLSGEARY
jgi:hypothetical protein